MWVYKQENETTWVVGYFSPHGEWFTVKEFDKAWDAAEYIHYLNGGEFDRSE